MSTRSIGDYTHPNIKTNTHDFICTNLNLPIEGVFQYLILHLMMFQTLIEGLDPSLI